MPRRRTWRRGGQVLRCALLAAIAIASAATAAAPESWRDRLEQRRAAAAKADGDAAAARLGPGTHTLHMRFQGDLRKYLVHVPARYNPALPTPLVLAFHGGGGHAEFMADDQSYGLIGKSEREGFVVVFPNGYSRLPRRRLATWNAGNCCGEARDRDVDDVGFARALVRRMEAHVRVDRARVFATGMSNGGMLVHRLACEAPEIFRAVASVAGTDATRKCSPAQPVSVLHVHARNDTHVLFDGGAGPDAFRDRSQVTDFVSVPETVARWIERNRCDPAPRRVLDRAGAYCEAFRGCAGGAVVQLCVTDRGGHSWPGAKTVRRGKEAASAALDANDAIWDFFAASAPP